MSTITWIIIVLIVISIAVTVTEVGLRFGILERGKNERGKFPTVGNVTRSQFSQQQLEAICGASIVGKTFGDEL